MWNRPNCLFLIITLNPQLDSRLIHAQINLGRRHSLLLNTSVARTDKIFPIPKSKPKYHFGRYLSAIYHPYIYSHPLNIQNVYTKVG